VQFPTKFLTSLFFQLLYINAGEYFMDNNTLTAVAATGAMALAYKKYLEALKQKDKQKADDYLNILQNNSEYTQR